MILWRVSPQTDLVASYRSSRAGRWSWASRDVLYTSTTVELAVLEALAHRREMQGRQHFLIRVELADAAAQQAPRLPHGWRADKALTRKMGNRWYDEGRFPILLVPSALSAESTNALLNPHHPSARNLRLDVLRGFIFDRRLADCGSR